MEIVDFAPEIVEAMLFYVYTGELANLDEVLPAYSTQNRRSVDPDPNIMEVF